MQLDGLSALIINPDIGSRARLREVLKNAVYKVSLNYLQNVREVSDKSGDMGELDIVLVSMKLGENGVREFVHALKNAGKGTPTFIVTLESQSPDLVSKVTSLYLDGVEGFISEPYSSEDLIQLLSTIKQKKESLDTTVKQKKTLQFLFGEARRCTDVLRKCYLVEKQPPAAVIKESRSLIASNKTLFEQNPELYAEMLIDTFEKVQPPKNSYETRRRRTVKKLALHPGRIISDLMLERKLTVERLQSSLKVEVKQFEEFLACKAPLDDPLARELSRLFGQTARDWLKLQKEYDHQQELNNKNKPETPDGVKAE